MHPAHYFLRPLPEPLAGLAELALDVRWSWNHSADALWRTIDPCALGDVRARPSLGISRAQPHAHADEQGGWGKGSCCRNAASPYLSGMRGRRRAEVTRGILRAGANTRAATRAEDIMPCGTGHSDR